MPDVESPLLGRHKAEIGRETIQEVFACNEWHHILPGTLRRVESGPPVLHDGPHEDLVTWLEIKSGSIIPSQDIPSQDNLRVYVKLSQILAVRTSVR